jgi:hypothetical protein
MEQVLSMLLSSCHVRSDQIFAKTFAEVSQDHIQSQEEDEGEQLTPKRRKRRMVSNLLFIK